MITIDCGGAQGKSVSIVQDPKYPYDIPICGLVVDGKHVEQKETPPENPPEGGGETADDTPATDGATRRRIL